eukprot:COSAG05_NODE_1198_length_5555_cov_3.672287_3_plen_53_part_00
MLKEADALPIVCGKGNGSQFHGSTELYYQPQSTAARLHAGWSEVVPQENICA